MSLPAKLGLEDDDHVLTEFTLATIYVSSSKDKSI